MEQMHSSEGASHFSLQSGFLNLDFKTGIYKLTQSPELIFPLVQGVITPVLTPTAIPAGTGVKTVVSLIEFFRR